MVISYLFSSLSLSLSQNGFSFFIINEFAVTEREREREKERERVTPNKSIFIGVREAYSFISTADDGLDWIYLN